MILPTLEASKIGFLSPMQLLRIWFENAEANRVHEPAIMSLATAGSDGKASNRIMRALEFRDTGLVFTSHSGSQKGQQLAQTHWASGLLYWPEISQQIIVSGVTKRLPDADSDALWAARSIKTHPMSTVSRQSEPLQDEAALREQAEQLRKLDNALPRPPTWVGYQLEPEKVEFWKAGPDGLHHRLHYERGTNGWRAQQLQP